MPVAAGVGHTAVICGMAQALAILILFGLGKIMTLEKTNVVEVAVKDDMVVARVLVREITDVGQANEFRERVEEAMAEQGNPKLVLDLSGADYMCSSAIASLCAMFRNVVAKRHGKMAICGVGGELRETLEIMRLDKLLPLVQDQDEAFAIVRG